MTDDAGHHEDGGGGGGGGGVVESLADDDTRLLKEPESEREVFELLATVLLALAAIAVAWAGFQSAKWSGVQATNFSQAGAARTESVRFSTQAARKPRST